MNYRVEVNAQELCYELVDDNGTVIALSQKASTLRELAMKLKGMQNTANEVNAQLQAYRTVDSIVKREPCASLEFGPVTVDTIEIHITKE